jgi:sensor domain CHASE-containing protein
VAGVPLGTFSQDIRFWDEDYRKIINGNQRVIK